jgi:hypothetical protein
MYDFNVIITLISDLFHAIDVTIALKPTLFCATCTGIHALYSATETNCSMVVSLKYVLQFFPVGYGSAHISYRFDIFSRYLVI